MVAYLGSGALLSSLFENWESEFLQMSTYVVLTAYLMQRGSPEIEGSGRRKPAGPRPRSRCRSRGRAVGRSSGRAGTDDLRPFLGTDAVRAVSSLVRTPLSEQRARRRRTSGRAWGGGVRFAGSSRRGGVLVRELPELAKRIPLDSRPGGSQRLPARARLSGINARVRATFKDRHRLVSLLDRAEVAARLLRSYGSAPARTAATRLSGPGRRNQHSGLSVLLNRRRETNCE